MTIESMMTRATGKTARVQERAGNAVTTQPAVEIRGLTSVFTRTDGSTVRAIDGLDLTIEAGEFVVLLGPSGCGKTTLLRSLAGLHRPDEGSITLSGEAMFNGKSGTDVPTEKRPLSMMFQTYALWPHMTIGQNVAYPLKFKGVDKTARQERVKTILASMGLAGLEDQYPAQLSGGQQQRAALARAIVVGDKTLLFDEPLSNVDAKVRDELRDELLSVHRKLGFTAVYVTHDQAEAMALATRVIVLNAGKISQAGPPREVYSRPQSLGVGRFFGKINEVMCTVAAADGDLASIEHRFGRWTVPNPGVVEVGASSHAVTRPEHWSIGVAADGAGALQCTVRLVSFLGMYTEYIVEVVGDPTAAPLKVHELGEPRFEPNQQTWITVDPAKVTLIPE